MRSPSRPLTVTAAAALATGGVLFVASPAHAAPQTVGNETELAAAIDDASIDTIFVDDDIELTVQLPSIDRDLTIDGQGHTIGGSDGTYAHDILNIDGGGSAVVTIRDLVIDDSTGFGIIANDADVTLEGITIDGTLGAAVFDSELDVSGSTFQNTSDEGLRVEAIAHTATITDSTFTGNDDDGIDLEIGGTAHVEISNVRSEQNDADGLEFEVWGSAVLEVSASEFNLNEDDGIHGDVYGDATVTITGVTVNGNREDGDEGDGIDLVTSSSVPVELHDITAMENSETGLELWVVGDSSIEVTSSDVSGNDFSGITAGMESAPGPAAVPPPADPDAGTISVTDSTLADNGAVGLDAFVDTGASLVITIERSTISGNDLIGATFGAVDGTLQAVVLNSTVSGNGSGIAAANFEGDGNTEPGNTELHVLHSTVAENGPTPDSQYPVPTVGVGFDAGTTGTVDHSIVWGTIGGDDLVINEEAMVTVDYALVGTASGVAATVLSNGAGNRVGVDPQLGPLADNGGPTLTHLPSASGPAAEAGDPSIGEAPETDQRGSGFPRIEGVIELGAVELPEPELAETGGTPSPGALLGAVLALAVGLGALAVRRRAAAQ